MKNARRKLEVPMPAAMRCKIQREKYWETCRVEKNCKTNYACIVEADESTRRRMEGSLHKNHEDHVAGKGIEFIESLQSCAQFYSYASSNEDTRCKKQQWIKSRKTREKYRHEKIKSKVIISAVPTP